MPEFLEKKLASSARRKGLKGRKAKQYIYGAMNNLGAMHGNQETVKGAEMERKHRLHTGFKSVRKATRGR